MLHLKTNIHYYKTFIHPFNYYITLYYIFITQQNAIKLYFFSIYFQTPPWTTQNIFHFQNQSLTKKKKSLLGGSK